ncbi:hypothetical protein N9T29_02360 [Candidatus Pelagibacter sp.]|nr:hypothetical protein [Candidatus Pelagibacter sp.]
MASKKNICVTNFDKDLTRYSRVNKEFISELSKKFEKVYILNLHNLRYIYKSKFKSIKKNQKLLPKNFIIINIKNSKDFINFSRNKTLTIILNGLTRSIIDFKIHYLFKKVNAKLIMISITGQWGTRILTDISLRNIFVGRKHIIMKSFYYVYRILTILNFLPKINLLIESSAENIKAFNNGLSRKFESIFPIFKISLYRKIYHVNSKTFDALYLSSKSKNNNSKGKKYILYIDSPIDSDDRIQREGRVSLAIKNKYYKNLFSALNYISLKFKKKIIVSLHPSSIKSFDSIKKKFTKKLSHIAVSNQRTVDLIKDSSIVLFSMSSAVLNAVIFKKKIISLRSKYFGEYNLKINKKNTKGINCPCINIDQQIKFTKSKINLDFKKSISSYDGIIKRRLTNGSNKPSFIEIVEILKSGKF